MGPFELMAHGNDVNFAVTGQVYAGYFDDPESRPSYMQRARRAGRHAGAQDQARLVSL